MEGLAFSELTQQGGFMVVKTKAAEKENINEVNSQKGNKNW